ncbi:MAG: hypothetical protein ACKVZJ_07795 [Phycisphaerales bacterium]
MEIRVVSVQVLAKSARVTLGSLWGGVLVLCGLWLVGGPRGLWLNGAAAVGAATWWAGLAAVSAGQYVFLTVAADRLCPMSDRRLPNALQYLCAGAFGIGVVGVLVSNLGAS